MLVKASCLGHVSKWSIDSWPFWHIQYTSSSRWKFAAFQVFVGKKLVPEMIQIWSRRLINLKQTVNVSSLVTVQSVPRFFSPTGSSLCFFSVVSPSFLLMPFRLLVESHPVKTCMAGKIFHTYGPTTSCMGMNLLFPPVPVWNQCLNGQLAEVIPT